MLKYTNLFRYKGAYEIIENKALTENGESVYTLSPNVSVAQSGRFVTQSSFL